MLLPIGDTMRTMIQRAAIGSSIAVFMTGCATERHPVSKPMPVRVPDISVLIDCGDCEVRPEVPDLIRIAYADAAILAGVEISEDAPTTVTIKEYTDRSTAIRVASFLAGPLAFALKDEIKAVVVVNGTTVPVEYAYRVPFKGIDAVATKLGEMSFDAITKQRPKD